MKKEINDIHKYLRLKSFLKRVVKKILGVKIAVNRVLISIRIKYQFQYNKYLNTIVKEQNKNVKLIPIIIISFNQLYYLKKLINFLTVNEYHTIVILDNNSSFKPLLKYFDVMQDKITIHRLQKNFGHRVFWENNEIFEKYSKGYYIITDPDIVPDSDCPDDFIIHFKNILDRYSQMTKVGFSLRLDNIPDTNINKESILKWESQFWKQKMKGGNYKAKIDTTFALYRPNYNYKKSNFLNACRTTKPYEAIHGGWYIDNENLTNEQCFYFENCNESSTWRIDSEGKLIDSLYLN